jgi:peroxiredoxin Q/BCP
MEIDITMIKYLLIILAASFLFSCAAEAQSNKQSSAGNAALLLSFSGQNR